MAIFAEGMIKLVLGLSWLVYYCSGKAVIEFNVGVMIISGHGSPFDVERSGAAIDMAFEKVNAELLNDTYRIKQVRRTFGPECDASLAPAYAAELFYNLDVLAFIGPGCSAALDPVGRMAAIWNVPVFTGVGSSAHMANKFTFPTLVRLSICQCRLTHVIDYLLQYFKWTDLSLLIDRDDPFGNEIGYSLDRALQFYGYLPNSIKLFSEHDPDYHRLLQDASSSTRIIVFAMAGETVRNFMLAAHDLGYIQSGEYVFIDMSFFPALDYWGDHGWRRNDGRDQEAFEAYDALLMISLFEPHTDGFEVFTNEVEMRAARDYGFNYSLHNEEVNSMVTSFHNAVWLFGHALNDSLEEGGHDLRDGKSFAERVRFQVYNDTPYMIEMDVRGDRYVDFPISDMNMKTGEFEIVGFYYGKKPGFDPVPGKVIHWAGGRTEAPPNEPFCGFRGDNPDCAKYELSPMLIGVVALLSTLLAGVIFVVGFLVYRRFKLEADIKDLSWIIDKKDLNHRRNNGDLSIKSLNSVTSLQTADSGNTLKQVFISIATYQGQNVALRNVVGKKLEMKREFLVEVKQRRDMTHSNIAKFIGAVVEQQNITLLHEYCPKGSLQDMLESEGLQLDMVFKMSLIEDVIQGMAYLHSSPVASHGRLTSSNCIVDGRFVVKITDFGLPTILGQPPDSDAYTIEQDDNCMKLLWRAPEHLREGMPAKGTRKGDVYSFGIILEEIILRNGPYSQASETMSSQEIIKRVKAGENPPFRPTIPLVTCTKELRDLIGGCLEEDPDSRPDFSSMRHAIKNMNRGKETNLMDNLLNRMEQYATNLEGIVAERTAQLLIEQRKTEQLLLQILPRSIAEQLKQSKSVDPETFEMVSIYFSDIVGFTNISAASTPMQIVAMLNDLYTLFDSILENYDVYKVETIGDAYMIVSGLPERNGMQHAPEIARVSLALLDSMDSFRIRHMQEVRMKLRIGLHSGSCVAGVVGLKMPRYCLFGDTVNTASRMESNGEALKIHMSSSITDILKTFDTFDIEERGTIEVKGKGSMTTYWLKGEHPRKA